MLMSCVMFSRLFQSSDVVDVCFVLRVCVCVCDEKCAIDVERCVCLGGSLVWSLLIRKNAGF